MMKMSGSMVLGCLFLLFHSHESAQYCSAGYVRVSNYYCISKKTCQERGFVIFDGYCRRACPSGFHMSQNDRTCHRSCPYDTVVNGTYCLNATQCTDIDMFVYNGGCVESCPPETVVTMSGACLHNCPHQTITNTTHCINPNECTEAGLVIYNKTCTDTCPPGSPYNETGVCASDCAAEKVLYHHQCITRHRCVNEEGGLLQNRSCVGSCSPDIPNAYEGRCYTECPSGTVVLNASLSTCLAESVCAERGQFIHNKTCIAECPRYLSGKVCVDECPAGNVLYNKECITITRCIDYDNMYMYVFNGTCVNSCPEEAPNISDNHMCYAVCPWTTVAKDNFCISKDECSSKVIHNNMCVTSCPDTAKRFTIDNVGIKTCYSTCPDNTVIKDKQTECISDRSCKSKQMVIFNGTCIDKCPRGHQYIEDGVCQTECSRSSVILCYEHCPDITSVQNITCISGNLCTLRSNFVFSGTCLTTCPKEAAYHSNGFCHHQCPQGQRAADTECIECESDNLLDGKECIYSFECAARNKFEYQGKCLSSCPHGTRENIKDIVNTKSCLVQPDLPLLLILLGVALLVCTIICICMTIPRNGIRTQDKEIKAILTTKVRRQVYVNHGFEEHEVSACCDDNNAVDTGPFRKSVNGGACDVEVVATDENDKCDSNYWNTDHLVDIINEMDQGRQSEI